MIKLKNVINKHKSNKIKENSNTVRHLNNGTDHRHSKSCCDQSSPARRTITNPSTKLQPFYIILENDNFHNDNIWLFILIAPTSQINNKFNGALHGVTVIFYNKLIEAEWCIYALVN